MNRVSVEKDCDFHNLVEDEVFKSHDNKNYWKDTTKKTRNSGQFMKDQFVLLLNNSYLNGGIPRNSGQFTADQTFHYVESTLYMVLITE